VSQRVVYRTRSPLSGLVKVVDVGADRRLTLDDSVLSIYARDGDWTRVRKEYWGEALDMVCLPRARPSCSSASGAGRSCTCCASG